MATRTVPRRRLSGSNNVPPGFIRSPSRGISIDNLTIRELHDWHRRNAQILAAEPGTSTSSYHGRITSEQTQIESRLLELESIPQLNEDLKNNLVLEASSDIAMHTVPEYSFSPTQSPTRATSNIIEAKRRALARVPERAEGKTQMMDLNAAMEIERRAVQADRERKARLEEKRRERGMPIPGEQLTRKELWRISGTTALAHRMRRTTPTGDPDEEDPATYFTDDQDDGVKGQTIIPPDEDLDFSDIIRIDPSHAYGWKSEL
ncbi:hypothetical protein DL96DRAFT_1786343 [Flagelloscypha sp. PMI_526]|nr:hypothetical protein DL96DRAFT_1786343 [Flagelloscypha sp. PMI_526]